MKVISKTISRNEFISRKNGVIPSLVDMWIIPETQLNCGGSESYVFGTYASAAAKMRELGQSTSLLEYKAKFVYQDHNYGLIVSDVIIPDNIASKITDYTDIYVNIPDGNGGYYDLNDPSSAYHYEGRKIMNGNKEVKILTYSTLNKWYTFFKSYFSTIKMYDNAIGLYNAECVNKHEDNMKYFKDLDDLFEARGGKDMYNWIIENCMPHDDNKEPKETFTQATNSASYVIPVLLTNSIDDLGEMTIFSTKWKDGVDYHNRAEEMGKCESENCYGTVVDRPYYYDTSDDITVPCDSESVYTTTANIRFSDKELITDYDTYIIKEGAEKKGYIHNKFHENQFKKSDWINYSDWYISENPEQFVSKYNGAVISTYAYSPINGKVLYNPGDYEVQVIKYVKKDCILSDGEYIEVVDGEYTIPNYPSGSVANVKLRRSTKLPVIKDGALKYAELNGKRFYAVKEKNEEKIYFLKESNCYDPGSPIFKSKYVIYNGNLFTFSSDFVSIDADGEKFIYLVSNGYFVYKGVMFYIFNNNVCLPDVNISYEDDKKITTVGFVPLSDDYMKMLGWVEVTVNDTTVSIKHALDVKSANTITGYTDSKLDLLRVRKINTDELGNELPGYIDVINSSSDFSKSNYNTAFDQCTLDILYKIGEVSNLEFQTTTDDGKKLYNGNYLGAIEFYHLDENGEKIDREEVHGNDSRETLAMYEENGEHYKPEEVLYCDITYYISATLEYDSTNFKYNLSETRHKGVKHIDTLTVIKSFGKFYMSDKTFFTFKYYELRGDMSDQHLDDFNDNKLTNMSYFEMRIMLMDNKYDKQFSNDYWENNNGMIVSPVFRDEHNLFLSSPQNVNSDIYIDRGINAAFETHIKLQEVHTLEALENFGNGFFKIN